MYEKEIELLEDELLHNYTEASIRKAWQTLKNAVLAAQTNNQLKAEILKLKKQYIFCDPGFHDKKIYNQTLDDIIKHL